MNFDFDLGKDDLNNDIIFRAKASLSSDWKLFKEEDQSLSSHTGLKLLPSSKSNYRAYRTARDKFVRKNLAKFYCDFQTDCLCFNKEELQPWTAQPTKSALKKVQKLKNLSKCFLFFPSLR